MNDPDQHRYSGIHSRFVVGIDLGTTNVAVSCIDTEDDSKVRVVGIPQLISPGEVATGDLLPSFCYLPGQHELPAGALSLPWAEAPPYAVGVFAREQGAAVPGRGISSAKSWLAHAGVERTRGILPWGSELGAQMMSPVEVSQAYLAHVRAAWDHRFGAVPDADGTPCLLADQQVILTVPASFDEMARELTLEAARRAGLKNVTLIEEPLAAFYAWLQRHEEDWREHLQEDECVLVVDVGGGTTDFSLVRIEPGYALRRTAVGDHLLLGGDNMDMALARGVETQWNTQLEARQWSILVQECRRAKEALLHEHGPDEVAVTVTGSGSSVIGGSRRQTLHRAAVIRHLLDGFFPAVAATAPPPARRRGIRAMGLPYAADPAVTSHLLAFLKQAGAGSADGPAAPVHPGVVLFNGGVLQPDCVRARILETLASWNPSGTPPRALDAVDLNLAVSRGAAYYGMVRRGSGVRVRGGIARNYYLAIDADDTRELVCVMPRDTDEGVIQHVPEHRFLLTTNHAVSFPLFCSSTRLHDRAGDRMQVTDDMTELPPLHTILDFGRGQRRALDVTLSAMLNEIGALDIWCTTVDGQHRFPLSFDLRTERDDEPRQAPARTVESRRLDDARDALRHAFAGSGRLSQAGRALEDALELDRTDWSLTVLRALADVLVEAPDWRLKSAPHEARWYNLTGFLVRPGFGAPGDDWRLRQLWKLWHHGPHSERHAQTAAEWWVFWRRIAGGLKAGHHEQIGSRLISDLTPRTGGHPLGPHKRHTQEGMEMWRCLGALERLSVKAKLKILRAVLESDRRDPHHWWVAARVGARRLFHGPADRVIPAANLTPLLATLFTALAADGAPRAALFAVANMCRLSGVRTLDLAPDPRDRAARILESAGAPAAWITQMQEIIEDTDAYQTELLGDRLPLGLSLAPVEE